MGEGDAKVLCSAVDKMLSSEAEDLPSMAAPDDSISFLLVENANAFRQESRNGGQALDAT